MKGLAFRFAIRADLPFVVRLLANDPLAKGKDAWTEALAEVYGAAFDRMSAQSGNRILLAELDGRIIGCLQLTIIHGLSRRGAPRAQVEALRVDEAARSRGIGTAMMRHAMMLARAEGADLMQLTTQTIRTDAQRFYARLGFAASHVGMKLTLV